MDLSVVLDNKKLNVRTTAVIIHENKLLVHKNANEPFCALVGGRVQIGENSEDAIKREIREEMGKEIEIKEYLTTIENLFEGDGVPYHEFMFVYRAEFKDEEDKKLLTPIKNVEGEDDLEYKWIGVDEFEKENLRPNPIRKMIEENCFPTHKIHDELKNKK